MAFTNPMIVAAAALLTMFLSHTPAGAAQIRFEKPNVKLGRVTTAGNVTHRFPFKVVGTGFVEIVDLRASCGCVAPKITRRRYKAGERGALTMGVHTTSQKPGKHRYQTTVVVRESRERTHVLSLDLELHREISVTPSNLHVTVGGRPLTQTITITDPRPRKLKLTRLESTSPLLKATVAPAAEDPAVSRITVEFAGGFEEGRHSELLAVGTDDDDYPSLVIPITVIRPSRLQVIPDQLRVDLQSLAASNTKVVVLRDRQGNRMKVASVQCDHAGISATVFHQPHGGCRLTVTFDPARVQAPAKTNVQVEVQQPVPATISIPITIQ